MPRLHILLLRASCFHLSPGLTADSRVRQTSDRHPDSPTVTPSDSPTEVSDRCPTAIRQCLSDFIQVVCQTLACIALSGATKYPAHFFVSRNSYVTPPLTPARCHSPRWYARSLGSPVCCYARIRLAWCTPPAQSLLQITNCIGKRCGASVVPVMLRAQSQKSAPQAHDRCRTRVGCRSRKRCRSGRSRRR